MRHESDIMYIYIHVYNSNNHSYKLCESKTCQYKVHILLFNLNTGKLAILNKFIYTLIIGISLCTNLQQTALGNFLVETGTILAFAVLNFGIMTLINKCKKMSLMKKRVSFP